MPTNMAVTQQTTHQPDSIEPPSATVDGSAEPVTIIGAGISGLALAAFLAEAGVPVRLFERQERTGGVMDTVGENGFLFETGPNTVLDRHESMDELLRLAGLADSVERIELRSQTRYIWHDERLHEVPAGPRILGSRLFSRRAKLRLAREPWVPPVADDESLKEFVTRRFGPEVYERAIVPMVCGTSGGDPARMSVEAVFPALKRMERERGSVLRGMLGRIASANRGQSGAAQRRRSKMLVFPGGMRELSASLEARLEAHPLVEIRRGTPIVSVEHDPNTFRLQGLSHDIPEFFHARRVVLSADAVAVATCLETVDADLAAHFRRLHYCPLTVIGLGVPEGSLRLPPGFGFLAVRGEGVRILGAIFNSNFMPGRAPEGRRLITVMVGGDLDPAGADLNDQQLMELLRSDLGKVLGWNGELTASRITRWPRAIPQFHMDHHELETAIEDVERRHPGLTFFGNWRGNPAVGERVEAARKLAREIAAEVRQEAEAAA